MATDNAGNTKTTTSGPTTYPAGVAGAPINLALTDASGGLGTGPIALTFTGLPLDWSLHQGTNPGNGTWAVEASDPSLLTITTPANFVGAQVINVNESWTNADGSTGHATVADNVEAYAPGSPIFAWSGKDTLTGSSGADLFVFAQPIGVDTVHSFDVAHDTIDLIGYTGFTSFADVQAHLADNAAGDAVITVGDGQSITLHGVSAASLVASNFVFDQTPVTDNSGNMTLSDGAMLPLSGTINNSGAIALNSTGHQTELQVVGKGLTLQGEGHVTLSNNAIIVGTNAADVLTNVDNIISGAGQIGEGDGNLTLVNGAHGTVEADVAGGTLTLDTGAAIVNNGVLRAMNGGTLKIDDPVTGNGVLAIAGGVLELATLCAADVLFSTAANAYGTLVIDHAADYTGSISNFTGTSTQSDAIDLAHLSYDSGLTVIYNDNIGSNTGGTLTLKDASGTIIDHIAFANGDYTTGNFTLASDGHGGTLITDPPTITKTALTAGTDHLTLDNGTHEVSATDHTLSNGDVLTGGSGNDTLTVDIGNGDHSFTFGDGSHNDIGLANFETLKLTDASATSDHAVTVNFDSHFHNNGTLTVDGSGLHHLGASHLTLDAHLATSDAFVFIGSASADTIIGGAKADTITGGGGGDTLTGNGGHDTFVFKAVSDSAPGVTGGHAHYDTITDFTHNADHIDVAAIAGLNDHHQAVDIASLSAAPHTIAPHTIDIVTSGDHSVVYANASGTAESVGSTDMEIHLSHTTNVTATDFILHH